MNPAKYLSIPLLVGCALAAAADAPPTATDPTITQYQGMIDKYCVTCHNETDNIPAGKPLYLDEADLLNPWNDAESWERVIHKLSVGAMPPQGKPHPDLQQLAQFRSWLSGRLDQAAEKQDDPGEFVLHRLNRAEYANAVRDLFGINMDLSNVLPVDSASYGFDNIATSLTVTPALLERYLSTAVLVAQNAIGNPAVEPTQTEFPIAVGGDQRGHVDGLPIGTRAGMRVHYNFPADGQYDLVSHLYRPSDNSDRGNEGTVWQTEFQILLDGVPVKTSQLGGTEWHLKSQENMTAINEEAAARMRTRLFVKAGEHDVIFTFVERPPKSQDLYQLAYRDSLDAHESAGQPVLKGASISGPFDIKGVSADMPGRQRIFVCQPRAPRDEAACAKRILTQLAQRAYRRPVGDLDTAPILQLYAQNRKSGGSFDDGIRAAIPRVLTDLSFLYRIENDPADVAPNAAHHVSDIDLASRLSFFLWSSIPDDELLSVAMQGKLHRPDVLDKQVRRMLADQRSKALTTNFPDQWLTLRDLGKAAPEMLTFPDWSNALRDDLQQETELFFDSVVREDRSALDLINADYTFVNDRVARLYGIPDIYGSGFRRVTLTDSNRLGLFGQASILIVTSLANRTSPVYRGKWVLANILDVPPLPPPANVPALPESDSAAPKSMRERLEAHRKNEPCAGCHRNMDPIGFALENFDPTGKWRDSADTLPIDSSGMLMDGTKIDGPVALRQWITLHPDVFVGTLTEKMMTYALGRGLRPADMPAVRKVVHDASSDQYRMASLVFGIVESRPFQERRKPADPTPAQPPQIVTQVQP